MEDESVFSIFYSGDRGEVCVKNWLSGRVLVLGFSDVRPEGRGEEEDEYVSFCWFYWQRVEKMDAGRMDDDRMSVKDFENFIDFWDFENYIHFLDYEYFIDSHKLVDFSLQIYTSFKVVDDFCLDGFKKLKVSWFIGSIERMMEMSVENLWRYTDFEYMSPAEMSDEYLKAYFEFGMYEGEISLDQVETENEFVVGSYRNMVEYYKFLGREKRKVYLDDDSVVYQRWLRLAPEEDKPLVVVYDEDEELEE